MNTDLSKLVIDRRTWYRGKPESMLRSRTTGKMCCLGFRAIQCGYTVDQVTGRGTPFSLSKMTNLRSEFGDMANNIGNSDLACAAMDINDALHIDETEREKRLTELFGKAGITVVFEN